MGLVFFLITQSFRILSIRDFQLIFRFLIVSPTNELSFATYSNHN